MESSVRVLSAGITTVQDSGRKGFENLGVAASGAWDRESYRRLGNLLGFPDVVALECLMGDLEVEFSIETVWAWTGPGVCSANGVGIPSDSVNINSGRIRIRRNAPGPIYLSVVGIGVSKALGSASTDTHSGLGPNRLRDGDVYPLAPPSAEVRASVGNFARPEKKVGRGMRFIGHDEDLALWVAAHEWVVSSASRAGVRFSRIGPGQSCVIPPVIVRDSASYPTLPGVVQVPSEDEIIVLGPDSGTTGGYSTAGALITVDIGKEAYLAVGESIRFDQVGIEVAYSLSKFRNAIMYRNIGECASGSVFT